MPGPRHESKALSLAIIEKINPGRSCFSVYSHFKNFPYSFFLDSALAPGKLGKFSFGGIEPFLIFKSKKDFITLDWITKKESFRGNPFLALKGLFRRFQVKEGEDFPVPFTGGGVGYFSYDLKDFNERLPDRAKDDLEIPDCTVCFYDTVFAFDHFTSDFFVISSGFPEKGKKKSLRQKARCARLKNRIYAIGEKDAVFSGKIRRGTGLESNFTKASYVKTVEKAKEYIKKGDIYQVNLSQRFRVSLGMEPFDLYGILRTINPAPFACFLNFGTVKVASASPERFLRKKGRLIETRPVKGTRPRGATLSADAKLQDELTNSAKDRAENLMIIDLERNDLGRISEYGSVRVKEFMACEEYATVFHLVSTVEGKLKERIDAVDCLINCFPGGSITGAPKIRSMEIIEELEPVKRSIYTGSIGYIGFDGNMDTSIVIRTFVIKDKDAYFQVGGGIVYDSDPEKEYQETLDKAKALIDAISYEDSLRKQKVYSAR